MNNRLYIELILGLIACAFAFLLQFVPKLRNNKKAKIVFSVIVLSVIGSFVTYTSIKDNPKVDASLSSDYIEFKKGEIISFNEVKSVHYYEEMIIKVNPNGYRWGNDDYYSGDADVRILDSDNNVLEFVYKGKVYINQNVHDYIVMNVINPNRIYIFNLGDKQETKNLYQNLVKRCFSEDY